jgi:hypothetical protein
MAGVLAAFVEVFAALETAVSTAAKMEVFAEAETAVACKVKVVQKVKVAALVV